MPLGVNDSGEHVVIDDGRVYETGLFDYTANWADVRGGMVIHDYQEALEFMQKQSMESIS